METKQSSIEWLMDEFNKIVELHPSQFIKINNAIEQAKEMHKQEMIEFSKKCFTKALDLDIRAVYFKIEEYYNETYETNIHFMMKKIGAKQEKNRRKARKI